MGGPGRVVPGPAGLGRRGVQAARKPNFVLGDHSSRRRVTATLQQPTRRFRRLHSSPGRIGPMRAGRCEERGRTPCLFGLAPCGVYHAPAITQRPVRSYRTFSPLPASACACRGGLFSVALAVTRLDASSPGRYPAHCPAEFGLSSPADTLARAGGSDRPAACSSSLPQSRGTERGAPCEASGKSAWDSWRSAKPVTGAARMDSRKPSSSRCSRCGRTSCGRC